MLRLYPLHAQPLCLHSAVVMMCLVKISSRLYMSTVQSRGDGTVASEQSRVEQNRTEQNRTDNYAKQLAGSIMLALSNRQTDR